MTRKSRRSICRGGGGVESERESKLEWDTGTRVMGCNVQGTESGEHVMRLRRAW